MTEPDRVETYMSILTKLGEEVPDWTKVRFRGIVLDAYKLFLREENEVVRRTVEKFARENQD